MKRVVHDFHTQIFPTREEAKEICKIGQGADTCIFLAFGPDGFECYGLNQMPIWSMIERARKGETQARREGCEEVMGALASDCKDSVGE